MDVRVLVLLAVALVLFGCIVEKPGDNLGASENQDAPLADQPTPPFHITTNLSFSRNASDVMNDNTTFPEEPTYDFSNLTTPEGRLIVYYFYSSYCGACNALRPEIDKLRAEYPQVTWHEYDLTKEEGSNAYEAFANQKNLSTEKRLVPQAYVNGTIITDRFNINDSLEGILRSFTGEHP